MSTQNSPVEVDIAVVGGGLVGASLALALARSPRRWRVALVEGHAPSLNLAAEDSDWDARVYAISPANQQFLAQLDAWPAADRIGVIAAMDVRGDSTGKIAFSAHDAGEARLAYIAENRWMVAALWAQLARTEVLCLTGERPTALVTSPKAAQLTLASGRTLQAKLVIGADGANSWVRQAMGVRVEVSPYHHAGVVANFATERPHDNIARQWFLGDGILAWLPLPDKRISIVWSRRDPEALTSLSPEALCETVAAAGGYALGALSCLTPAVAFPLRLMRPETVIAERVALAGDAAHTVHPLAGQGVNLGFGDAIALADLLGNMTGDPGDYLTLRRYQRARREAVTTMQLGCDSLFKLFHTHDPVLGWLRNTGLSLTNQLAPVKRLLARQAIGY